MLRTESVVEGTKAREEVKGLYTDVFPGHERIPFWLLMRRARLSSVEFLAYYDEDRFVGFTYLVRIDDLAYLFYLAVNPKIHSKGYGSRILQSLEDQHPDCRIGLDIEAVTASAENYEQRVKRRDFYLKNGYACSGHEMIDRDGTYEVMVKNGSCTTEELAAVQKLVSGSLVHRLFGPHIKLKES